MLTTLSTILVMHIFRFSRTLSLRYFAGLFSLLGLSGIVCTWWKLEFRVEIGLEALVRFLRNSNPWPLATSWELQEECQTTTQVHRTFHMPLIFAPPARVPKRVSGRSLIASPSLTKV